MSTDIFYALVLLSDNILLALAGVISKSYITHCDGSSSDPVAAGNATCKKKFLVSFTLKGDQVKQFDY